MFNNMYAHPGSQKIQTESVQATIFVPHDTQHALFS